MSKQTINLKRLIKKLWEILILTRIHSVHENGNSKGKLNVFKILTFSDIFYQWSHLQYYQKTSQC